MAPSRSSGTEEFWSTSSPTSWKAVTQLAVSRNISWLPVVAKTPSGASRSASGAISGE